MGCPLTVANIGGEIKVSGNTCKRGEVYGKDEFQHPKRAVTSLVKLKNGEVASVKTSDTVPKERIFDVVNFIGSLAVDSSVKIGDIVATDVLGLGVNIIITGRK